MLKTHSTPNAEAETVNGKIFNILRVTASVGLLFTTIIGNETKADTIEILARGNVDLPPNASIELRPIEDRPEYRDIAPALGDYLAENNYRAVSRGDLILRYSFQVTGTITSLKDPNFAFAGKTGIGGSSNLKMEMRFRNKSRHKASNNLIMIFELYRPGEPPLWSARVLRPNRRSDKTPLLSEMSAIAIKHIGKNINTSINSEY